MKKHKCPEPEHKLSAPLYMLTWGDMITLFMAFFALLFALAPTNTAQSQAQFSVIQGSLGVTELYQHSPMQKEMPAPSVKQTAVMVARTHTQLNSTKEKQVVTPTPASGHGDNAADDTDSTARKARSLGLDTRAEMLNNIEELTIVLPTYEVFDRGEWKIDMDSPAAKKAAQQCRDLAQQIANLHDYDVHFTGHTDSTPVKYKAGEAGPKNNTELGFLRAQALYDAFFADILTDKTRVAFASQGDNVPIIPNATLDSERRKNRRVEITLRRVISNKG